jgi:hypothetical protein
MSDVNGDYVPNQIDATFGEHQDGAGGSFVLGQVSSTSSAAISGSAIGSGGALVYRMRGYDGTLGYSVYWISVSIDTSGAQYTGPGPLSNIVVYNVIGH